MKVYWDTSALLEVILGVPAALSAFNAPHERITRAHTLAEAFSQLTGGRMTDAAGARVQLAPNDAARAIAERAVQMEIVSLSGEQILTALKRAQKKAVRGGAIHDFLHATAAELNGADRIYTLNLKDFRPVTSVTVRAP
jgi:predicted nucleic acid-binding protein